MTAQVRIAATGRVLCVAALLGLGLSLTSSLALQGTLLLAAVAAVAVAAEHTGLLPQKGVVAAEAALAALVVGMALPEGVLLLPYLVIPPMVAGMTLGLFSVLVTASVEFLSLLLVVLVSGELSGLQTVTEILGPWLVTTISVGLIAVRFRALRFAPWSEEDASYESARRLLTQLRKVARRLSSGLDAVTMATQLLAEVHHRFRDTQATVLVSTEAGVLAPLAHRGEHGLDPFETGGDLVARCWTERTAVVEERPDAAADCRYRVALPLRVGDRMVGMVLLDAPAAPSPRLLDEVVPTLGEQALRIDTALAFDEIRSLATMEERHRLAREIHDGIAQEIASLGYVVDDLTATAESAHQRAQLNGLRTELTRVVSELRLSIFDLRGDLSGGLGSALSDHVREVGARSGLTVHLTLDVVPTRLRGEVEAELLRIAQEAITNARKHSGAANLWVDCRIRPPFARISVRDDGYGLGKGRQDSFGLSIMRERSERIGAALDIRSAPSTVDPVGTEVTVTVGDDDHASVA